MSDLSRASAGMLAQVLQLSKIVDGNDMFVTMPNGYRKFYCNTLLPVVFEWL